MVNNADNITSQIVMNDNIIIAVAAVAVNERKESEKMKEQKKVNERLEKARRKAGMPIWKMAELAGVSETTMYRKMRHEMPEEEQGRIIALIEEAEASDGR